MTPQVLHVLLPFMATHFKNLTYLALTIQKLKDFELPFAGISQTWHPQFQTPTSIFRYQ